MLSFALPFILIISVLGSILGGIATPTEAAGVGAFGALLLGVSCEGALILPCSVMLWMVPFVHWPCFFLSSSQPPCFAYVFRLIGGEHFIVEMAQSLDMGDWGILVMLMLMIFALGFFFDWIEITLIMLPIVAPIVEIMDLGEHVAKADLIYWFAILMAVNLQTSFLTPPFGFALFFLKGAARDLVTMKQIYRGIIPFVVLQILVLALIIWQPWLVLWLPRKML